MKVSELMTREPASVGPDSTLGEAATLMKQEDCGSLPVVEERRLVGIITDRDIVVRAIAAGKDAKTTRVADVMSADPITVRPDDDVDHAEHEMRERQVRRLPVVDDGRLVGMLVTAHIARADRAKDVGQTIEEISKPSGGRGSHARG